MPALFDLSVTLRSANLERGEEVALTSVPHDEAARAFARHYGLRVSQLPHGSFFATERGELGSPDPWHQHGRPRPSLHARRPDRWHRRRDDRHAHWLDAGPPQGG